MEQNEGQNQNPGFFRKNQKTLLIVGIIVLLAIGLGYYATQKQAPTDEQVRKEQTAEVEDDENQKANLQINDNENQNQIAISDENAADDMITLSGILQVSDPQSRGNLMLVEESGRRIYIVTQRDFSGLLEKEVALIAHGTIESFVFLNLMEAGVASAVIATEPTSTETADEDGIVRLSGLLQESDDESRGNYLILSQTKKVYLESQRNYNAWIGTEIELQAKGTVESFAEARLFKK